MKEDMKNHVKRAPALAMIRVRPRRSSERDWSCSDQLTESDSDGKTYT
jgi:hypothetical protein